MTGARSERGVREGKRHTLRRTFFCLLLLAAAAFLCLQLVIGVGGRTRIAGDPQVMIILGCQVKPWGPSTLLKDRLDTALVYLDENPDMIVVLSGGQGRDEPVSEAQAMFDYLTELGIDEDCLLLEDQSHSTWENLTNSVELLTEEGYDVTSDTLLVSNAFHLARARMLWSRAAGTDRAVSTLAAPSSHCPTAVRMFFREPLALVKSFILDR